jgi:hypothetical protein
MLASMPIGGAACEFMAFNSDGNKDRQHI